MRDNAQPWIKDIGEVKSEAEIYAEGTRFTPGELVNLYRDYVTVELREGRDPDDCQRFFEREISGMTRTAMR